MGERWLLCALIRQFAHKEMCRQRDGSKLSRMKSLVGIAGKQLSCDARHSAQLSRRKKTETQRVSQSDCLVWWSAHEFASASGGGLAAQGQDTVFTSWCAPLQ